jgi:hypothetical protein
MLRRRGVFRQSNCRRVRDDVHVLLAAAAETGFLLLVFGLPLLVVWLWALVDAAVNPGLSTAVRVGWLLAVVLLPGVGALVYVALPGRTRLRLGGQ